MEVKEEKKSSKFSMDIWQTPLKTIKSTAFGRIFWFNPVSGCVLSSLDDEDDHNEDQYVYVELGRRMKFPFKNVDEKSKSNLSLDQVTIRDIRVPEHLQKQGLLTGLIHYLLFSENCEAVQLESIQNKELGEKCIASSKWHACTSYIPIQDMPWYGRSFFTLKTSHVAGKSIF